MNLNFGPLQPGKYRISCKATKYYVGRHIVEDKSLNPKRIMALEILSDNEPTWELVKSEGSAFGHYLLKTRGTPTSDINGMVYALLLESDEHRPTEWQIKQHLIFGMNYYTIELANNPGVGWAAPNEEENDGNGQIKIQPTILRPGIPLPQIPDNMLFEFEKE